MDEYICIDAYEDVKNPDDWLPCPKCNLVPKIWTYDNGRSTACGCGESRFNHHSIKAESIRSYVNRTYTGCDARNYDSDGLRKNWNHWVRTGEILFPHQYNTTGRW